LPPRTGRWRGSADEWARRGSLAGPAQAAGSLAGPAQAAGSLAGPWKSILTLHFRFRNYADGVPIFLRKP
jgi:predicted component of type VI protein secretion system